MLISLIDQVQGISRKNSSFDENLFVHRFDQRSERDLLFGLDYLNVGRSRNKSIAKR